MRAILVAGGGTGAGPLPDATLDLLGLPLGDGTWVWWSCLRCRVTIRTTHWWALNDGCSHGDFWKDRYGQSRSNREIHGTFDQWCSRAGLTAPPQHRLTAAPPPPPTAEEEDNPWL